MSSTLSISSTYLLNSGYKVPVLGYGVFKTPPEGARDGVIEAISNGYRLIDSAAFYENEEACATGILESGVPREDIFFTSKIPPNATSYDGAKAAIKQSLQHVAGLKYIDLMLIHAPYGGTEARIGAWRALVEAVEAGHIRSIGVSNYGIPHLEELQKHIADIDSKLGKGKGGVLSVNQVEVNPWLPRKDIKTWCDKHNIRVQAWAPLAQAGRWNEPALKDIAQRVHKSEAQILLRWSLQQGFNPLPKSVTPSRITANTELFDFELSDEDMATLDTDEYDFHGWDPTTSGLE